MGRNVILSKAKNLKKKNSKNWKEKEIFLLRIRYIQNDEVSGKMG